MYILYTKQYPILSPIHLYTHIIAGDKVEKPKSKRFGKFGSSMRGGFGKLSKKKSQDDISSKASEDEREKMKHEIGKLFCGLCVLLFEVCVWCVLFI